MYSTFEKIKNLADNQGLSLNQLEARLGYSRNTIYNLKTKKPSAERVSEIADYFNVSTDYLLGRTDDPEINRSTDSGTAEYRAIQRKARNLNQKDQQRLLEMMDIMFQEVLSGGGDNEHNI